MLQNISEEIIENSLSLSMILIVCLSSFTWTSVPPVKNNVNISVSSKISSSTITTEKQ